jgi:hypothetical protein
MKRYAHIYLSLNKAHCAAVAIKKIASPLPIVFGM